MQDVRTLLVRQHLLCVVMHTTQSTYQVLEDKLRVGQGLVLQSESLRLPITPLLILKDNTLEFGQLLNIQTFPTFLEVISFSNMK